MLRNRLPVISFALTVVCLTLLTGAQCPKIVADPVFSPNGGNFDGAVNVTITSATPEAAVHYTLDGSDPTETSPAYGDPIRLAATTTVKARAFAPGLDPSNIVAATFTRNADQTPDSFTFDVQWAPTATVIDQDKTPLLKSIDQNAMTYTFDSPGVLAAGLDISAGRVLAIFGEGISKVASVTDDGIDLVAVVEPAELTEAITDGTIAWDYGVRFTADRIQDAGLSPAFAFVQGDEIRIGPSELAEALANGLLAWEARNRLENQDPSRDMVSMPYLAGRSIANDGTITLTFKNGNFEYEIKVQLLDTTANFEFTMTKEILSKVAAKFVLKGSFGQFRSKSTIKITGGQLREFGQSNEKLGGNATISLVVEGSGNDVGLNKTFPIFKVPFVVGYIPVSLDIGAQFVVNAVVPIGATANISADFSYDSDMGLSYNGSKIEASAQVGGHTISVGGDQPYVGGTTQVSANFGVGFPHIEVSIGHKWLAEGACWFHPAFLIGGSWTANGTLIPNCMKVDSQYILAAGYSVSVLDGLLKPLDGKKTLFDEKKPLWQAGDCPPAN